MRDNLSSIIISLYVRGKESSTVKLSSVFSYLRDNLRDMYFRKSENQHSWIEKNEKVQNHNFIC